MLYLAKGGVTMQVAPAQDKGFASQLLSPLQVYAGELYPTPIQGCGLHNRKGKELLGVFQCVCSSM